MIIITIMIIFITILISIIKIMIIVILMMMTIIIIASFIVIIITMVTTITSGQDCAAETIDNDAIHDKDDDNAGDDYDDRDNATEEQQ